MSKKYGTQTRSIFNLFQLTSTLTPLAPALVSQAGTLTYAELAKKADRLAAILQQKGVSPGAIIGLCLVRSPELIISVLGILKAGAAYVPIDPAYPAERINAMLDDARPPMVITDKAQAHLFPSTATLLLIDEADLSNGPAFQGECPAGPDDLGYVLFTSGSTGRCPSARSCCMQAASPSGAGPNTTM